MAKQGAHRPPDSLKGAAKSTKKNILKKGKEGPWDHCDPKLCTSCEQDTHDIDRDSEYNEFLQRLKKRAHKSGVEVPAGDECTPCFGTRRKHFHPMTQQELDAERKKPGKEALDLRWAELRRDKVSGCGQFKKEGRQNIELYTEKGTKGDDKEFISGSRQAI